MRWRWTAHPCAITAYNPNLPLPSLAILILLDRYLFFHSFFCTVALVGFPSHQAIPSILQGLISLLPYRPLYFCQLSTLWYPFVWSSRRNNYNYSGSLKLCFTLMLQQFLIKTVKVHLVTRCHQANFTSRSLFISLNKTWDYLCQCYCVY